MAEDETYEDWLIRMERPNVLACYCSDPNCPYKDKRSAEWVRELESGKASKPLREAPPNWKPAL